MRETWPELGRPLADLRIVELSSYVATPLSGLVLAQLGAEVIRVEPLGGGADRTRRPLAESGTSLYWSGLNNGKRAVAVNFGTAEGRRLVADLIVSGGDRGGIVISNSERYDDLTFATLSERRTDLIHVQLTGRRDGAPAVDYTVQAATGFPMVTGPEGSSTPVNTVFPAFDVAAGLYLATGLLAAERARRMTGRGQQVRLALEDAALAMAGALGYLAEAQLTGTTFAGSGNYVYGVFGRDFKSVDGTRFMLVILTTRHWHALLEATGLSDVVTSVAKATDADFDDEGERYRCRQVLGSLLEEWFGRRTYSELEETLGRARVLWAPYRTFADLGADDAALLRGNPLFADVEQRGVGRYLAPGSPLVVAGAQVPPAAAPAVGEHTDAVLARELSYTTEHLKMLREDGHIG
jgi:2-methylfumaryl-CoA isomerase